MSSRLPDGWSRRPIGSFSRKVRRMNSDGEDLEPLSITKDQGVILQRLKYKKRIATDPCKYQIGMDGDFAFDPMSLYYGAIGRIQELGRGLISPDYVTFSVDQSVDHDFLEGLLRWPQMHKEYEHLSETSNSRGKRRRLYWSVLTDLRLTLPPLPEQKKIAAILASVDEAIQETQAVIEQTRRVKEGLLQDLLTRGIGHTQFKQTEIGEIPESWEITRVRDSVSAIIDYRGKTPPYSDSGVPVISQEDVQPTGLLPSKKWITAETAKSWVHRGVLQSGDLVFRMERFVGEVAQVPGDQRYVITRGVLALRPAPAFSQDFFFWVFFHKKRRGDWDKHGHATTVPRMYKPDLLSDLLPVPPLDEQTEIAERVSSIHQVFVTETAKLDALKGVKAGLLQDLLTGKVRVSP